MEEGQEECLIPFEYSLCMTKTTRSDDNLVDARTDQNPNNFHITFEFQVLNCLNFDNGVTNNEAIEVEFYDKKDWICSQFIANEACRFIFDQLELSGICSVCIDHIVEVTISEAMLALSNSKESSSQHQQELLSLCIYKYARWEEAIEEFRAVDKQVPATKESIDALKKAKLEGAASGCLETCVICYENLWQETTMDVTGLPCSHMFHGNCIVEWLNRSHLCPLCRYDMPTS